MSTKDSASTPAYVVDYESLMEGIAHFLELEQEAVKSSDVAAIREHYEQHPEDKLCYIYRPGTREMVSCRRSGIDAIERMALRLPGAE